MTGSRAAAVRYTAEAAMLPPLVQAVDVLVKGLPDVADREVLFEVQAFESIPDLVIVQLDHSVVARRVAAGVTPLPDVTCVRALAGLSAGVDSVDGLVGCCVVSRAHLQRNVVPALVAAGWLTDRKSLRLTVPFEPVLKWVVTVEAKRTKWREAYAQARRQKRVADRAFVALDAGSANPARAWSGEFANQGIGLLTVDARTDTVRVERRPRRGRAPDVDARRVLGERVVQMTAAGVNVGRTFPVFGRVLPMQVGTG